MPRLRILSGTDGRHEDRVQIIRKEKHTTRINRPTNPGRSWALEDDQVDTDPVLNDDSGDNSDDRTQNEETTSVATRLCTR